MAMKTKKAAAGGKKPKKLQIDFTGVESGGRGARVPEGEYVLKISDYVVKTKKDDEASRYIQWSLPVEKGPGGKGKSIVHRTSLKSQALFNLKNMMEAAGFKVPSRLVDVPLEKMVGRSVGASVFDGEPYEGKIKSEISGFYPASEWESMTASASEDEDEEDEDEEDEESATSAATDDEDEDEEEDLELEEVDDEL